MAEKTVGWLWMQSQNPWFLGLFQKWFVSIDEGRLRHWASQQDYERTGLRGARGSVDLTGACCVVEHKSEPTRFTVRPVNMDARSPKRRGQELQRPMVFDASESSHPRVVWVGALLAAIGELNADEYREFERLGTASTSGSGTPRGQRRRKTSTDLVDFNLLGLRVHLAKEPGQREKASLDAVLEQGEAKLWIGNLMARNYEETLASHSIKRVVDCLEPDAFKEIPRLRHPGIEYMDFPIALWEDVGDPRSLEDIARIMAPLLGFVEDGLAAGESVLIHCFAGAHRSGAAGAMCMMHLQDISADAAVQAATEKRQCIDIFMSMEKLLFAFERLRASGKSFLTDAIAVARAEGYSSATARVFAAAFEDSD